MEEILSENQIDESVEFAVGQYSGNSAKVMQFATDATRILSTTADNLERIQETGFFARIKSILPFGKNNVSKAEFAALQNTVSALANRPAEVSKAEFEAMKQFAAKSLEALNERNLLTADALITVENNLKTIGETEKETRQFLTEMANKVADRFEKIESKVANLEESQALTAWIAGIEVDKVYKSLPETIRFLKIVKDYYQRKKSNYSRDELLLLPTAIRNSGIDHEKQVSLGYITDSLIDELQDFDENEYLQITQIMAGGDGKLSGEDLSQILAVPTFVSIVSLPESMKRLKPTVKLLQKANEKSGSTLTYIDALKMAIKNDIQDLNNIDMEKQMSISDLGIELISCYSALPNLVADFKAASPKALVRTPKFCTGCGEPLAPGKKFCSKCGKAV